MSQKRKREHEQRIRLVASMLTRCPPDELVIQIQRRFRVSEAVALTYIKRARNLPTTTIRTIERLPTSAPLDAGQLGLLADSLFSGKLAFAPAGGQCFRLTLERPEQASALAWMLENHGGVLSPEEAETARPMAERLSKMARKHTLNLAIAEAFDECARFKDGVAKGENLDFASVDDAKRFRDRLQELVQQAAADGLTEDAENLLGFQQITDRKIRFNETCEDVDFLVTTLRTLLRPAAGTGDTGLDLSGFQSQEQRETFRTVVLRLYRLLANPADERFLREAWQASGPEIGDDLWKKLRMTLEDLAAWAAAENR